MSRSSDAQDAVLRVVQARDEGVDARTLQELLPDISTEQLMLAINACLKIHRLQVFKRGGTEIFKYVTLEEAQKLKGLTPDDILVHQLIAEAGNLGIWSRDIKLRSNLPQGTIGRIIKNLESKHLIKAVRSVEGANRKVYMLMELEPAQQITGGAWYTDRTLDSEFVEKAREICLQLIRKNKVATLGDIMDFIKRHNVFTVDLTATDVDAVVHTLIYDGLVEEFEEDGEDHFRPARLEPKSSSFGTIPCGVCPVIHNCSPDGPVSPYTCEYFKAYFNF